MSLLITPADTAFSFCVRERAGWKCERCGTYYEPPTKALHCAHVFSRGSWSTRFEPHNAISLCYGCHRLTEQKREAVLIPLYVELYGRHEYDRLLALSKRDGKAIKKTRGKGAIAKHFRAQWEKQVRRRMAGLGRLEFDGWRVET